MAATGKNLARGLLTATGITAVYTTPALQATRVLAINLCNVGAGPVVVQILFGSRYWLRPYTMAVNENLPNSFEVMLGAGEVIGLYADTANAIEYHVSGIEDLNG